MRFDRKAFETSGEYVFYIVNGERKFVARFKHKGPFTKAKFLKQLVKNFSVEEYFSAYDKGVAPLAILRDQDEIWYYDTLESYYGRDLRAA